MQDLDLLLNTTMATIFQFNCRSCLACLKHEFPERKFIHIIQKLEAEMNWNAHKGNHTIVPYYHQPESSRWLLGYNGKRRGSWCQYQVLDRSISHQHSPFWWTLFRSGIGKGKFDHIIILKGLNHNIIYVWLETFRRKTMDSCFRLNFTDLYMLMLSRH